jgi:hypothetical protein
MADHTQANQPIGRPVQFAGNPPRHEVRGTHPTCTPRIPRDQYIQARGGHGKPRERIAKLPAAAEPGLGLILCLGLRLRPVGGRVRRLELGQGVAWGPGPRRAPASVSGELCGGRWCVCIKVGGAPDAQGRFGCGVHSCGDNALVLLLDLVVTTTREYLGILL